MMPKMVIQSVSFYPIRRIYFIVSNELCRYCEHASCKQHACDLLWMHELKRINFSPKFKSISHQKIPLKAKQAFWNGWQQNSSLNSVLQSADECQGILNIDVIFIWKIHLHIVRSFFGISFVFHVLLSSIYIRRKYWIRENFRLPVFDGFTCFEMSWTRFDHF